MTNLPNKLRWEYILQRINVVAVFVYVGNQTNHFAFCFSSLFCLIQRGATSEGGGATTRLEIDRLLGLIYNIIIIIVMLLLLLLLLLLFCLWHFVPRCCGRHREDEAGALRIHLPGGSLLPFPLLRLCCCATWRSLLGRGSVSSSSV